MKKIFKGIVGALLVSALMVGTIMATDVIVPRLGDPVDPMGSCYFEITVGCTYTEWCYGENSVRSEMSEPTTQSFSGYMKHGEEHSGVLSGSLSSTGNTMRESHSGVYTVRTYPDATITYRGYLSCNGDISELKAIINE